MNFHGKTIGLDQPFFLIAGPCVIESEELQMRTAERLKAITDKLGILFLFKSSFDKANRSSGTSFRGPGMDEGLRILEKVRAELGVPVLTDVHDVAQVKPVADVVDMLQTPAFLARQTDFIHAVAARRDRRGLGLVDHILHIARRHELRLLDVDRLAGAGDGLDEIGLAGEERRSLDHVDHFGDGLDLRDIDRKSTRLNSSHRP